MEEDRFVHDLHVKCILLKDTGRLNLTEHGNVYNDIPLRTPGHINITWFFLCVVQPLQKGRGGSPLVVWYESNTNLAPRI
jgi:hypothetical protein